MLCAQCNKTIEKSVSTCPSCGKSPLLHSQYRLLEILGQGGMGTTYKGQRINDGKILAVKEILLHRIDSMKTVDLFQREASVLRQLDHEGVPEYFDDFSHGQGKSYGFYLIQEYIDGQTLEEEFEKKRSSEKEVLTIVAELLDIVSYLQNLSPPVVHRDIKPKNIMRDKVTNKLVLIDFGAVRDVVRERVSGGSTVAGTFGYMAPEQFMGIAERNTDIYAVAATAIALLTRREPHELLDVEHKIQWNTQVDVSPEMRGLLEAMLLSDPKKRPADAGKLANQIRDYIDGKSDSIITHPHVQQIPRIQRSERAVATFSPPPPDAPRELPKKFMSKYAGAGQKFFLLFGSLFGGIGGSLGFLFLIIGITSAELIFALIGGIFTLLFGGIGGGFVYFGLKKVLMQRKIFQTGDTALGQVTESGRDTSVSVNGKNPYRIHYEFEVNNRLYSGEFSTFEAQLRRLQPDHQVYVLYVPDDPDANLLYF